MSLSGFLPKTQGSDWLTYLVYQLEACFFGGKQLKLMSLLGSLKEMILAFFLLLTTLCAVWMNIFTSLNRNPLDTNTF